MLTALQPFLPPASVSQHAKWARKVCAEGLQTTGGTSLAKTVLSLFLKLSRRAELELDAVCTLLFLS